MRMIGIALGASLALPAMAQSTLPSDEDVRALLATRVESEQQSIGIAVTLVEDATRVVTYGTLGRDGDAEVDGNTLFEIGSVTKMFTSLLLADAVVRGDVRLDQTVASLLPEGARVPERGREITLLDLATHFSGLPRLPDTLDPVDPTDPYADFVEEDLLSFLAGYTLSRDVGAAFEYSNLAYGLLGYALATEAGTDYGTLVRERILEPLGMTDTVIEVLPQHEERFATGHDADLQPVMDWSWDVLAGAGALRSTPSDMGLFVSALTGKTETVLAPAIALAITPQRELGDGVTRIGLGWMMQPLGEDELIFHSGGTFGARAFVGFMREGGAGVAALSNVATTHGVDDLGVHLLDQSFPLVVPPAQIAVDTQVFSGLEGSYALTPDITIAVFVQGEALIAQLTGQEAARIYPESETRYFYRIVDAQIEFDVDEAGIAQGLTLYQFGEEMPAPRISE